MFHLDQSIHDEPYDAAMFSLVNLVLLLDNDELIGSLLSLLSVTDS